MPAPWSNKLIRTGVIYSGLLLAAGFVPLAFHPDRLSKYPVDWVIGALVAIGTGFALSTIIWFIDSRLPQFARGSEQPNVLLNMLGWLVAAAVLFLTFYQLSH